MPFHFCADEFLMLMSAIPFAGIAFKRIHNWYHAKFHHEDHK